MNASAEALARMTPNDVAQLHHLTDDELLAYRWAWRHSTPRFSRTFAHLETIDLDKLPPAARTLAARILYYARHNQETTP